MSLVWINFEGSVLKLKLMLNYCSIPKGREKLFHAARVIFHVCAKLSFTEFLID